MPQGYQIMVLAEMVDAFDQEEPKPGRETTAFIKRWRAKELEEKHKPQHHLQMAIRDINLAEIQNIRETKQFRDDQREHKYKGPKKAAPKVEAVSVRNVIW